MSNDKNQSEVARIKAEMEAQQHAAELALYGLAQGTSQHQFITAKMVRLGELQDELIPLVGKEDATVILIKIMNKKRKEKPD